MGSEVGKKSASNVMMREPVTDGWRKGTCIFDSLNALPVTRLDAKLGMVIFFVDRSVPSKPRPLDYSDLERFVGPGKDGLIKTLNPNGDGVVPPTKSVHFWKR